MPKPKHPMQPIVFKREGKQRVARFKGNEVVKYLLSKVPFFLNDLHLFSLPKDDQQQFAQLIGYSVSGYGDLSYRDKRIMEAADDIVEAMTAPTGKEG